MGVDVGLTRDRAGPAPGLPEDPMRTRFPLPTLLLLAGAALAGCSGSNRGGATRAATPVADATPRANSLQHDYVASPQAHFDQMVVESRAQAAASKAAADATASKTSRSGPKSRASGASASGGFPALNTGAPAARFPAPTTDAPAAGFPAPRGDAPAAGFPVPQGPLQAPEPVARDACDPRPCIGGDPCIQREAAPHCAPSADVALHSSPQAAR